MKMLFAFYFKEDVIVVRAVDYSSAFKRVYQNISRESTITPVQYVSISWKRAYDNTHPWNWQEKGEDHEIQDLNVHRCKGRN